MDKVLEYILKQIESFPDATFSESELIRISKESFLNLKEHKYIEYVQRDPEEELYYDKQGNERFVQKIKGQCYGFSTEDSELGKVLLTKEELRCWTFNMGVLLNDIKAENGLSGKIDYISSRICFIGEKITSKKIGFFLGLFADEEQAELELLSLKSKVGQFDIILVLCPFFRISSQDLLNKLENQSITCICFEEVFHNTDFIINFGVLKGISLFKASDKIFVKFPTPTGTKWEDIFIIFMDRHTVKIKVGTYSSDTIHYSQMGFAKKDGKPDKQWELLEEIAMNYGMLKRKIAGYYEARPKQTNGEDFENEGTLEDSSNIDGRRETSRVSIHKRRIADKIKKQKQLLGDALKDFFTLPDDPFYPYIEGSGWRARFKIFYKE